MCTGMTQTSPVRSSVLTRRHRVASHLHVGHAMSYSQADLIILDAVRALRSQRRLHSGTRIARLVIDAPEGALARTRGQ